MYVCMYVYVYTCMYVCMYVCIYVCVYIYIYIYTHILAYITTSKPGLLEATAARRPDLSVALETHCKTHVFTIYYNVFDIL